MRSSSRSGDRGGSTRRRLSRSRRINPRASLDSNQREWTQRERSGRRRALRRELNALIPTGPSNPDPGPDLAIESPSPGTTRAGPGSNASTTSTTSSTPDPSAGALSPGPSAAGAVSPAPSPLAPWDAVPLPPGQLPLTGCQPNLAVPGTRCSSSHGAGLVVGGLLVLVLAFLVTFGLLYRYWKQICMALGWRTDGAPADAAQQPQLPAQKPPPISVQDLGDDEESIQEKDSPSRFTSTVCVRLPGKSPGMYIAWLEEPSLAEYTTQQSPEPVYKAEHLEPTVHLWRQHSLGLNLLYLHEHRLLELPSKGLIDGQDRSAPIEGDTDRLGGEPCGDRCDSVPDFEGAYECSRRNEGSMFLESP